MYYFYCELIPSYFRNLFFLSLLLLGSCSPSRQQLFTSLEGLRQETAQIKNELASQTEQIDTLNRQLVAAKKRVEKFQIAFDFYQDKYALAYGEQVAKNGRLYTRFYFMDKEGNYLPELGTWEKATQFNTQGLSKVELKGETFLLNTEGTTYFRSTNLTDFENPRVARKITALDLSHQELVQLDTSIFQYSQLQCLLLNNNGLTQIPSTIKNLKQLEYLDLSANRLDKLPAEISNLKKLKKLTLNRNRLQALPKALGKLEKLEYLNLAGSPLKKLPPFIGNLKNLRDLQVQQCLLTTLPKEIGQLKNLQHLNLFVNNLTSLPEEIGTLERLEEINLEGNKLKDLPLAIGNLSQLRTLTIIGNQLKILPSSIGKLKRLENIWAANNHITAVPSTIGNLASIKNISLWGNFISSLPEEIGQLQRLENLLLSGNEIDQLPATIAQLANLKKLKLDDNPIPKSDWAGIKASLPTTDIRLSIVYKAGLASKYFKAGHFKKAFTFQEEQVIEKPNNANAWYNLSWYALFANKPIRAIEAAQKTKTLDPQKIRVDTNLALGYLMNDQWEQAKIIYQKYKGKTIPDDWWNTKWDKVFIEDIQQLKAAGIVHDDFEKVKKLLIE